MAETAVINVTSLVYGGDAMGRLEDGRAVFVPFAIPGETVRIRLVEEKPRFARGELVEVLDASPERVTARCTHFMFCGGCQYQHMAYFTQVEAKSAILREQLERIGRLREIPTVDHLPASEPWRYRNHIQFHVTDEGKPGFQKRHSNQTFAIRECHLPDRLIDSTWPLIELEPMPGLERISLRSGWEDDLMLILETADDLPLEFEIEGLPISVVQQSPAGSLVLAGSDSLRMQAAGRRFTVSAGSFFQVHTALAGAMVHQLLAYIPLDDSMTVLDAYCGVGLFSATLAQRVKQVVGIEISPQACADFSLNLDEFDNVSLYEAGVEEVINSVQFTPDAIVVDPPREGLGAKTVAGILSQGATQLVYVSCDPATLARDGRQLTLGGYKLEKISLVDMFPQTYHIESLSYWVKA